jgi:hypothetical protein
MNHTKAVRREPSGTVPANNAMNQTKAARREPSGTIPANNAMNQTKAARREPSGTACKRRTGAPSPSNGVPGSRGVCVAPALMLPQEANASFAP